MTDPAFSPADPFAADLLDLAVDVARDAGRLLLDRRPDELGVAGTKSSPTDVVTVMDTAAERLIVSRLREARPDDAVLGEEGGGVAGSSRVRWVVDPIDGTVNYLYDLPGWGVSIAAEVDREVALGVVNVPAYGDLFTAVRGRGAALGGEPIRCTRDVALSQALVATGFSYTAATRRLQAELLRGLLPRVRDIRRHGAASVDLCAVARGRVDAFYERDLAAWDLAAGVLIAREAGALVTGLGGDDLTRTTVLAAGPGLFEPLRDLLVGLGAD